MWADCIIGCLLRFLCAEGATHMALFNTQLLYAHIRIRIHICAVIPVTQGIVFALCSVLVAGSIRHGRGCSSSSIPAGRQAIGRFVWRAVSVPRERFTMSRMRGSVPSQSQVCEASKAAPGLRTLPSLFWPGSGGQGGFHAASPLKSPLANPGTAMIRADERERGDRCTPQKV